MAAKRKGRGRAATSKAQQKSETTPSPEPESTEPRRKSWPLPAAVVLEICTHAHPLDVLHLARTCKTLRRVLCQRSSTNAWSQVFRNAGLPKCPDDIAGPQYAAMFYESVCDGCGSNRCKKGRKDVHWDVRRRLCIKCARKLLVDVPKTCPGLADGLLEDLVPTSGVAGSIGKAYEPLLRKLTDEIQAATAFGAPQLATLVDELKRKLGTIESHSRECEQWNEAEAKKSIEEEDIALRKANICSRLENEGWGEKLDRYRPYVLNHQLVNHSKRLFDDDWELYREVIKKDAEARWTAKHESKLLKQRKRDRYRRWVLALIDLSRFEDDKKFRDGEVWPDGNDLRRMPELQPMLNGVNEAVADNGKAIHTSTNGCVQSLADRDLAGGTVLNTTASEDPTLDDDPDGVVDAGGSDDEMIDSDGETGTEDEDEDEDDNDSYFQDGPYFAEAQSDSSDESILPPGHDPDLLSCSSDSESDSASAIEDRDSTADSPAATEEKAAITAAMDRLFPSALIAWRHSISLRLFASIPDRIIRSLAGDVDTSTDAAKIAFLSRAATVFECRGQDVLNDCWLACGAAHDGLPKISQFEGPLVFYPEALCHRDVCAIDNTSRMEHFEERTKSVVFDPQEELRAAWSPNSLKISRDGSAFMKKLVGASGLDHMTTTLRELDEADARFVCKGCLDMSEANSESALKVHNWLACLHDAFPKRKAYGDDDGHCGGQHSACFVRVTNLSAEARVHELAPRGDKFQPLSIALSELGLSREALLG